MNEAEIVRRVLNGDVNAFARLVDAHGALVLSIALKHVPRDKAAELAHETFVRAFEKLGTFRGDKPFSHWLARIAISRCAEYWRGRQRNREDAVSSLSQDCRDWIETVCAGGGEANTETLAERSEARLLLDWALGQLSPDDRLVLTMTHLEGQALEEVAGLMGWSVSKVKVRSHRARRKLRELLGRLLD
jgi:RNA polymerase sigma-70 factor (ECF subfamily)